jgi:MerR family transcriptional regulator, light-induced transcriptional regulator
MKRREYPIRAVSRLTGLSIDTLRAWERRYGAVIPGRTSRGRVYSEEDIERLILLRRGTEKGYSIGQIAKWDNQRLSQTLSRHENWPGENQEITDTAAILDRLIDALKRFDAKDLDTELARLAILYPPGQLVQNVVLPLMNTIGEQWNLGNMTIAQEHLASASLRNVLGALMRHYVRSSSEKALLFATPQGEHHEFGILGAAMTAVSGGLNVLYLGPDLPADEILRTIKQTSPKAVVLGWKAANGVEQSMVEIKRLAKEMPRKVELWIGGVHSEKLQLELKKTKAILISDFEELKQHLKRIGWRS